MNPEQHQASPGRSPNEAAMWSKEWVDEGRGSAGVEDLQVMGVAGKVEEKGVQCVFKNVGAGCKFKGWTEMVLGVYITFAS
nr:hypothetical protein [Tanacetum cinerariifolium]